MVEAPPDSVMPGRKCELELMPSLMRKPLSGDLGSEENVVSSIPSPWSRKRVTLASMQRQVSQPLLN